MSDEVNRDEVLETFASLADTLVADYDVVDLLQTLVTACARLLDISEAGLLLADDGGELELVASTSEASRLVEVLQLSANAGPCIESYRSGQIVAVPDISVVDARWAHFRDETLELGFRSVYAIPLRLRDVTIGTLNLLRHEVGQPDPRDVRVSRALANVATIGILHERAVRDSRVVEAQLRLALDSRVVIEQAKGLISYQKGVAVEEAFELLRSYSRSSRRRLSDVADDVVHRRLEL
ncbi:MAG TPA: GAF and ANTAR domain-containing protein [Galbitalea sp.]|jgi:GAF domain-containing protein